MNNLSKEDLRNAFITMNDVDFEMFYKTLEENEHLKKCIMVDHHKIHYWVNIVEQLEEWLKKQLEESEKVRIYDNNGYDMAVINTYENVIDKIQELKGSEK